MEIRRPATAAEDWMDEQFRAAGNVRIGVGYITWSMALNPKLLDQALARKPAVFVLSFGDERPFAEQIKRAGVKLICQVQDLDGAKRARDAGAEIIATQGTEAGGHGKTSRSLMGLVPAVADAVS